MVDRTKSSDPPDGVEQERNRKHAKWTGASPEGLCVNARLAGAEPSGAKKTTRSGELNREPKKQCGLFGHKESGGKRNEREMRRRIDVSNRCHHIVFGHTGTTSTTWALSASTLSKTSGINGKGSKQKFDAEPHGWSSPSTAEA